jgi:hypothetical protein
LTLVMAGASRAAEASSLAVKAGAPGPAAPPEAPGLRTDRLSAKQRERWQSIVRLVFAADDHGRPLHPTLRRMWDEVVTSSHEVYVELPEASSSACCVAGLFGVESVRPDGRIVATVQLNLEAIDSATVGHASPRGFHRFQGLGREGRYAEVLGHELGHAVWTLADPARACQSLALRSQSLTLLRALPEAKPEERTEIRRQMSELSGQAEANETPARAAEAQVWQELVATSRLSASQLD